MLSCLYLIGSGFKISSESRNYCLIRCISFSTVTDLLNKSLGHASYNRKLSKKHRVRWVNTFVCLFNSLIDAVKKWICLKFKNLNCGNRYLWIFLVLPSFCCCFCLFLRHIIFREDPVRMPPIIDFTTETTREKEWDNIGQRTNTVPRVFY